MKKDIKIVSGDGKDLEISPVYEHLNTVKPKTEKTNSNTRRKEKIISTKNIVHYTGTISRECLRKGWSRPTPSTPPKPLTKKNTIIMEGQFNG